jgi:tRNA1(Val) A37 N6-methylase TrmN6
MPSGCGCGFESDATRHFNDAKVAKELKNYREHGLGVTTRLLADGIARSGALGGTVLDVGAGFGGLALTLLERGASTAVAVDASAAYIAAARAEAHRQGRSGRMRFVHEDFVTAAPGLPPASIVTLDRVVCCYPSFAPLIEAAAGRAERCLALSYPRVAWYVHAAMGLENVQRRLKRNPFRAFVHPVAAIEALIARAGFQMANRRETWMWSADVYLRI